MHFLLNNGQKRFHHAAALGETCKLPWQRIGGNLKLGGSRWRTASFMGHQRLGKLPAGRNLPEIIKHLIEDDFPIAPVVNEISTFVAGLLQKANKDPVFIEALWLLVRLPQAAAEKDAVAALAALGFDFNQIQSTADVAFQFDQVLERKQRETFQDATDLGEMARRSSISSIYEGLEAALPGLWAASPTDVTTTLATLRSPEKFADIAQNFFARLAERAIHFYMDRNLRNMVGPDRVVGSVNDIRAFDDAIRRHCNESALIMRGFARDWLGKNHFHEGKAIDRAGIKGFSAYVATKISKEMAIRKGDV